MGLVNANLVDVLAASGLIAADVCWSERDVLGEWLAAQNVSLLAAAPVLETYFGLPYLMLDDHTRLQPLSLAVEGWPVYQSLSDGSCVCLRPPQTAARHAYRNMMGETPLYITDAVRLHTLLLSAQTPALSTLADGYKLSLETLRHSEPGHVDHFIGHILCDAIDAEATDVHFFKMGAAFRVVFRINGALETYVMLPLSAADGIINKLKLLAEMDIAEHRLPQDGHIHLQGDTTDYNLRLGTLPLLDGEKIVLRILPEQQRRTSLAALGYSEDHAAKLTGLLRQARGLVLITGPTNSGKTTTLYACLRQLSNQGALVYTIEDPVEAVLPEVQQMQVNARSGFDFAAGLRGILRSDPDVIAVGELRDKETVDIAARAALSGQMVIATLHAYNAQQAVDRLRDLGLSDLLLGAVLTAVVNQRLLVQPCAVCGGKGRIAGGGICPHCMGSGHDGRIGVQELWCLDDAARADIACGSSGFALRQKALAQDFLSLAEDARRKGLTLNDREG
ncbi:MAG: ATPase, T2SS/T4P/T4SS family [Peptococcaceae bacterium]|nr:ATPase, T2SS/T4P/T4SS family [Peptococcaceae bacterium]